MKEFRYTVNHENLFFHHTLTNNPDDRDFSFKSHSHSLYEIFIFLQGKADFTLEGNKYELKRGNLIFIPKGYNHNILIKASDQPYERMVFIFSGKDVPKGFGELISASENGKNVFLIPEEKLPFILEIGNIIAKCDDPDSADVLLSSSVNLLLSYLKSSAVSEDYKNATSDEIVNKIIKYVNKNFGKDWHLCDLEKELFRDKAFLNSKFKSVMGCNIWEYNIQKRIFSAQQEIYLSGDISLAFRSSGFSDYSSFYRQYIKYIGISPREDHKRHNK